MKKILAIIIFIIGGVILWGGCNMQNRLLYFPEGERPSAQMLASSNMKLWQDTAADYQGLMPAIEMTAPRGTIIIFHGNGGTALDRSFYLKPLIDLEFRVILAEYPQYGGRPGNVGEKHFVAAALKTLRLAHKEYGAPLYLLGESLGCGVVAAAAKQTSIPVAGIILITPWDTLAAVAKSLFPYLPVKLVLTDKYDSIENLQPFQKKISIVAAERDEILPVKHAISLYNNLPEGRKRLWIIKGAGHNDWPFHADTSLFKEITDFVQIDEQQKQ